MERKKAIEVIKKNWPDSSFTMLREALESLIPELAESEDERIRKSIIELLKEVHFTIKYYDINKMLAWLEKQSKDSPVLSNSSNVGKVERKPAWSEEDEENLNWFEKFFRAESVFAEGKDIPQDRYLWFKNLKGRVQPKQEWSEEDDQLILSDIIYYCKEAKSLQTKRATFAPDVCIDWLKSIRPHSQWKPSDEQIESLSHLIDAVESEWVCEEPIGRELLEQLKKLKG